jgi:serine phosphatase RsbU (regulator of sigma subunit)/anti-sigma regulatory factor (Ser/Thr protein kinase)
VQHGDPEPDEADREVPLLDVAFEGLRRAQRSARREAHIAETLQHSLLLDDLPATPSLSFAVRYVADAREGADVGGDWYDVIPLRPGTIGVAIGDVVGHGVDAAARMGHLQSALRAYALEGYGPAEVMERMNFFAREAPRAAMATLVYGVLDPAAGTFKVTSAGHPPPLSLDAAGNASFFEGDRGSPLGVHRFPRFEERTVILEPGASLLLYTDGLVESASVGLEDGLEFLAEAVRRGPVASPDELCSRVLETMLTRIDSRDDVALLAVRFEPQLSANLRLELPAEPASLAQVRSALGPWLQSRGASSEEVYEILVGCGEACANAIEHAYTPRDAVYEVLASCPDGKVEIIVTDTGHWREPRGSSSGRGFELMRKLMDAVFVESEESGTTVRLVRKLGAAAEPSSPAR